MYKWLQEPEVSRMANLRMATCNKRHTEHGASHRMRSHASHFNHLSRFGSRPSPYPTSLVRSGNMGIPGAGAALGLPLTNPMGGIPGITSMGAMGPMAGANLIGSHPAADLTNPLIRSAAHMAIPDSINTSLYGSINGNLTPMVSVTGTPNGVGYSNVMSSIASETPLPNASSNVNSTQLTDNSMYHGCY